MTRCNTCRWWHATAGSRVEHGTCRKYPPTVQSGVTDWPITHGEKDWCGEHEIDTFGERQHVTQ